MACRPKVEYKNPSLEEPKEEKVEEVKEKKVASKSKKKGFLGKVIK